MMVLVKILVLMREMERKLEWRTGTMMMIEG